MIYLTLTLTPCIVSVLLTYLKIYDLPVISTYTQIHSVHRTDWATLPYQCVKRFATSLCLLWLVRSKKDQRPHSVCEVFPSLSSNALCRLIVNM